MNQQDIDQSVDEMYDQEEAAKNAWIETLLHRPMIQVTNQSVDDVAFEVSMWPSAMKDHNIMLGPALLTLHDQSTRGRNAPNIFRDPLNLVTLQHQLPDLDTYKMVEYEPQIARLKRQALLLIDRWQAFENHIQTNSTNNGQIIQFNVQELSSVWRDDLIHKMEMKQLLQDEVFIGSEYISFVEGVIDELLYFRRRLEDSISPEEELQHWVKDASLHMALAAHLLDPGLKPQDRQFVLQHLNLAEHGRALKEAQAFITIQQALDFEQACQDQNSIDRDVRKPSAAHPLTLIHVMKEGDHAIQRLHQLGQSLDPNQEQAWKLLQGYLQ